MAMPTKYNVWNNWYTGSTDCGSWASTVDFDTEEQAQAWMQKVCIERQDRLNIPPHLRMNYEVRKRS